MHLSPELSVTKMYELYLKECSKHGQQPVKQSLYRLVFDNQYNLGFHKPKKDNCDQCTSFRNLYNSEKQQQLHSYEVHRSNADAARKCKTDGKNLTQDDSELVVACFDLQEVLMTPKGFASAFIFTKEDLIPLTSVFMILQLLMCNVTCGTNQFQEEELATSLHVFIVLLKKWFNTEKGNLYFTLTIVGHKIKTDFMLQ